MDCVVIGVGVVGLVIVCELVVCGCEMIVLEVIDVIGMGMSLCNSEVIYVGFYYLCGLLKVMLCVYGCDLLYEFCEIYYVLYWCIGKLFVVMSVVQVKQLKVIVVCVVENGVFDLLLFMCVEVQMFEFVFECVEVLFLLLIGIVDSYQLMFVLFGDVECDGVVCVLYVLVELIDVLCGGCFIVCIGGGVLVEIDVICVINSVGFGVQVFVCCMCGFDLCWVLLFYFVCGNYFSLLGCVLFLYLIYLMFDCVGFGVYLMFDFGGQVCFGLDVEWCDLLCYEVDLVCVGVFYMLICVFWLGLFDDVLQLVYVGIWLKFVGFGELLVDFIVQGVVQYGVCGFVNLFGIELLGFIVLFVFVQWVGDMVLCV